MRSAPAATQRESHDRTRSLRRTNRALVLVAHPRSDSFTHAVADAAVRGLRRHHEVEVVDLYDDGFTCEMSCDERRAYHSDHPLLDPLAARYARLARWADCLVFVYPTWWSGMPAMLKGWLERVLVPGVAFRFDDAGRVVPNLTNVRRLVGVSTYGSPRRTIRLVNDNGRRTITRALRMSCGSRTTTSWIGLYAMDRIDDAARERFLHDVEARMVRP